MFNKDKVSIYLEANTDEELMESLYDMLTEICSQRRCDLSCPYRDTLLCQAIEERKYEIMCR